METNVESPKIKNPLKGMAILVFIFEILDIVSLVLEVRQNVWNPVHIYRVVGIGLFLFLVVRRSIFAWHLIVCLAATIPPLYILSAWAGLSPYPAQTSIGWGFLVVAWVLGTRYFWKLREKYQLFLEQSGGRLAA
ncbi:MAG: hypothetical protein KCHDKBKB_02868 [Elusimicrobia bacterium]|nr:hypothetical protein [Elusimicrobiota bacterium]